MTEVYYYMIYSTASEERKRWADEYIKMITTERNEQETRD